MRSALIIGAAAALAMAAPAQAAGGDVTDVSAPPALALFGMAVAGLLLGRRWKS